MNAHQRRAGSGEPRHAVLHSDVRAGEAAVLVGVSLVDAENCPLEFGGLEEFTDRLGLAPADDYGLRMLLFPDAARARRRATLVTSAVQATRAAAAAWVAGGEYVLPPFPPDGTLLAVLPSWPTAFVPVPAIETLFDVYDFFEPWSLDPDSDDRREGADLGGEDGGLASLRHDRTRRGLPRESA